MIAHTPTPWTYFTEPNMDKTQPHMKFFLGADGQGFAHTVGLSEPTDTANAAHIVHCVNSHAALIRALTQLSTLGGGRSEGNCIAQEALKALGAAKQEVT